MTRLPSLRSVTYYALTTTIGGIVHVFSGTNTRIQTVNRETFKVPLTMEFWGSTLNGDNGLIDFTHPARYSRGERRAPDLSSS